MAVLKRISRRLWHWQRVGKATGCVSIPQPSWSTS